MTRLFLCLFLLSIAAAKAQTGKADGKQPDAGPDSGSTTRQARRGDKLTVDVKRSEVDGQQLYQVTASGTVLAAPATVWKVLTSYDKMHEFVPDMASCKVLTRNGNEAIIEQFGNARLLFVTKAIHLIVRATETPQAAIDIALISGDMKQYEARWELQLVAETGGTRILYSGKMVPDFYVPGLLGSAMVRSDITHMMAAVLARMDSQRDGAGRTDGAPAGTNPAAPPGGGAAVPAMPQASLPQASVPQAR